MTDAGPLPAARNVHYHHLDALRAAFMLAGVFVHASTLGDDAVFDGIGYTSGLVRMEGFFLISGFLSAMLVQKYGAGRTVRRRLVSIGVPFMATMAFFNPLTLWLEYNFHNPGVSLAQYFRGDVVAEPSGFQLWHMHLWFLAALLMYALCTPPAFTALSRLSATPAFDWAARSRLRAMTAIVGFVVVTTIVGRAFLRVAVEPVTESTQFDFLVEATVELLPFFLAGLLLYAGDQRLLASFCRPAPLLLAVSGGAFLAAEQEWVGVLAASTVKVLIETVLGVALIATLFAIAARLMPRQRPAVRYLADASYTVYLLHFFWLYALATLFSFDPRIGWPQMLLVSILTFGATMAIHHFLIRRSDLLRALFNGKFPAEPREAPVLTPGETAAVTAETGAETPPTPGAPPSAPAGVTIPESRKPATAEAAAGKSAGEAAGEAERTAAGEAAAGRRRPAEQSIDLGLEIVVHPYTTSWSRDGNHSDPARRRPPGSRLPLSRRPRA